MFLASATLNGRIPTMDTRAISEKIKNLASTVNANLSAESAAKIRAHLLSYANELQGELIDNTLDVSYNIPIAKT